MNFFRRFFLLAVGNYIALVLAARYVPGFYLSTVITDIVLLAVLLAVIYSLIRPILKLILSPIIFLTGGLFVLIINGVLLALLDFYLPTITIKGLSTLLYATLLIGIVTFLTNSIARLVFRE